MDPLAPAPHGSRFRWVIVALLFLITIFNYVDRSAISYAVPIIEREFGLGDRAVGLILGAFGIGYFVTTLVGGFAVDRFGSRRVLLIAALVWSAAIGGTGLAIGAVSLFLARILLGLAEGPNFPAMTRAVGDWLPPDERATALARSLVAVPLALAVSAPVVTALLGAVGWRAMFVLLGVVVLLWVPFWVRLYRDDPARSAHVDAAELAHIRAARDATPARDAEPVLDWAVLRTVLMNRTLLANTWSFFVFGYFLFFFMSWLPDYLEKAFHLSLRSVGMFAFLPWFVAAIFLWVFGSLSDRLLRHTGRLRIARSRLIMSTQAGAAIAVIPVAYAGSADLAICFIALALGLSMSVNAAYFAVTIDVTPRYAGTALGVMDAAFALAGVLAPSVTGYIVALTGSFGAAFWVLAVLAASSVIVVFLFHHPDDDRVRDATT